MNVIPPVTIEGAVFVSSSVSEPDASAGEVVWSGATTYAIEAEVISTSYHRKFESLQAGNLNNALPVPPETENAWWIDVGPTNRWAMFDLYRNTQTEKANSIVAVIHPGERVDSIAVLGIEGTSISIFVNSASAPSVNHYSYTEDLTSREVPDWYAYFFDPFEQKPSVALFDLPPYADVDVVISIVNSGGTAKCGSVVVGLFEFIGETVRDATSEALNFSIIERDEFGNATLVPRRTIPQTSQRLMCDKSIINTVRAVRTALNAVPAVWSGLDEDDDHGLFETLLILGIARSFKITVADPDCSVELELEEI